MLLGLVCALVVLAMVLWRWALTWPHDDDDQMYYAMFRAEASPVATPHGFYEILSRLPVGSRVLDVGIGSGTYLEFEKVHSLLRQRKLTVHGVDISVPNVAICRERIAKRGLARHADGTPMVSVEVGDARALEGDGSYDAIIFMESFPCMSVGLFVDILRGVQRLLKPGARTFLYHNLSDPTKISPIGIQFAKVLKPSLKLLLGIDFGRLTTSPEMTAVLRDALPDSTFTSEVLLSASCRQVKASFGDVKNKWFAFWGRFLLLAAKLNRDPMEQNLITINRA